MAPVCFGTREVPARVLIVDDELSIHEDYRRCLEPPPASALERFEGPLFGRPTVRRPEGVIHFSLLHAHNPEEAIAVVSSLGKGDRVATAFVDMRMGGEFDGVDTIRGLWAYDPAIQMVLATAYSDFSWSELLAAVGRDERVHLLRKPFSRDQLRRCAEVLTHKWVLAQRGARGGMGKSR